MSLMPLISGDTSAGAFTIAMMYSTGPTVVWDGKSPLSVTAGAGVIVVVAFVAPSKTGTFSASLQLAASGFMSSKAALKARVADVAMYVPFDPLTLFQGTSADLPIVLTDLSTSNETVGFKIADLPHGVSFKLLPSDPLPVKAGAGNLVSSTLKFHAATDATTGLNQPIRLAVRFNIGTAKPFPRALTILKKPSPARNWHVTGPGDHATPLDRVIKNFMEGNNVRAAALAVVKDTRLVFAHGYTWGEANYPVTEPTTLFRLASCSKPLTAMAILRLIEGATPGPTLDTPAQILLGLRQPDGTPPPQDPQPSDSDTAGFYFYAVTIKNLLQHKIGWGENGLPGTFDPIPDLANKNEIASWAVSQKQMCWPGTRYGYCNFGYLVLGLLLERLGIPFTKVLVDLVCKPVKLKRLRRSRSLASGWPPPSDEALYHDSAAADVIALDQLKSTQSYTDPIEHWDSSGGLSAAAPDYAKVLAALNADPSPMLKQDSITSMLTDLLGWDQAQPDPAGGLRWFKGGRLSGASTSACLSQKGFSYILLFNRGWEDSEPISGAGWPIWADLDVAMAATTMSTTDLFIDSSIHLGSL
jgi:CubicO group peptidase (beta-lactamase class C family)